MPAVVSMLATSLVTSASLTCTTTLNAERSATEQIGVGCPAMAVALTVWPTLAVRPTTVPSTGATMLRRSAAVCASACLRWQVSMVTVAESTAVWAVLTTDEYVCSLKVGMTSPTVLAPVACAVATCWR